MRKNVGNKSTTRKPTLMEALAPFSPFDPHDPDSPPPWFSPLPPGVLGTTEQIESRRRENWKQYRGDADAGAALRRRVEKHSDDPEWLGRAKDHYRALGIAIDGAGLTRADGSHPLRAEAERIALDYLPKPKGGRPRKLAKERGVRVLSLVHIASVLVPPERPNCEAEWIEILKPAMASHGFNRVADSVLVKAVRAYIRKETNSARPSKLRTLAQFIHALTGDEKPSERTVAGWIQSTDRPDFEQVVKRIVERSAQKVSS